MKLSDLQSKKIIDVSTGTNIGTIFDAKINEEGIIEELIIDRGKNILSLNKDNNITILWKNITKIGEDVILVRKDI